MMTAVDEDTVELYIWEKRREMWMRDSQFSADGEVKCHIFSGADDVYVRGVLKGELFRKLRRCSRHAERHVDGENLQNAETCWLIWTTSMEVYDVGREGSGKGTRSGRSLCAKTIKTFLSYPFLRVWHWSVPFVFPTMKYRR